MRRKRIRKQPNRTNDMQSLVLFVLAIQATLAEAGSGCRRRGWIFCRGGSSPQTPNYNQKGYGNDYGPPELPPDLPSYGDSQEQGAYHTQQQPPPELPQYQDTAMHSPYEQPPPLPPRYADVGPQMERPPPGFPGEPMFQEPEANEASELISPWDDTANDSGTDLSSFDKEYILKGLAKLYKKKILPLELSSRYGHFHSPPLSPADFVAPPMVLLLGQYRYVKKEQSRIDTVQNLIHRRQMPLVFSVGKTSFIKYLLGRDFPGIRIGPEPTTDRFTSVLWGPNDKIVPGAALCSQQDRPFTGLSPYGNNFLSRLEGVELDSPILCNVTLVDTPGILSGQKQRNRNYDYESVMKWFGERADLVIVMFDAHKLDISDELKRVMELFIPHIDKIRIVLNKADSISTQQLMRVYGALMWSLGKVLNTPEVCRVYMVSVDCRLLKQKGSSISPSFQS